jgi:hypothetical protein
MTGHLYCTLYHDKIRTANNNGGMLGSENGQIQQQERNLLFAQNEG